MSLWLSNMDRRLNLHNLHIFASFSVRCRISYDALLSKSFLTDPFAVLELPEGGGFNPLPIIVPGPITPLLVLSAP